MIHENDVIRDESAAALLQLCHMSCRIFNIAPGITQEQMFRVVAGYVNRYIGDENGQRGHGEIPRPGHEGEQS